MATRRQACAGLGAAALAVSWDRPPPLVQGDALFAATVREALGALDGHWGWLTDMLDVIRPAESGELPGDSLAGLLVKPNGYVAIINPGLQGVAYTASLIAHEGWHAYQHSQGRRYYGREAEREAWALQACVLADLSPGNLAVPWLLGSIAGLTDGGPLSGNPEV